MPYFPDSAFGLFYAFCCFGAIALVFWRGDGSAKSVAVIMAVHWFTMRGISSTVPDAALAWVLHDAAMVVALLVAGKIKSSQLSFACAALFFGALLFDQAWWLSFGSFKANAAVAEAAGYICFLLMGGATFGDNAWGYVDRIGGFCRRYIDIFGMENGRSISGRTGLHGADLAANPNPQKKNGRTAAKWNP